MERYFFRVLLAITVFSILGLVVLRLETASLSKEVSNFKTVSGPNWDFKVLSVENTGKQKWREASFGLSERYFKINENDLSFWRVKVEVKQKKSDLELHSDWIQLIYETNKGEEKRRTSAATIATFDPQMGDAAIVGRVTRTSPDLSIPAHWDLLFLAPKNTEDVKYMAVQFLDYPKVHVIPK